MASDNRNSAQSLPQQVQLIVEAALKMKASKPLLLDIRGLTDVTDYFLICTADAEPHARAITESVEEALKPVGRKPWHVEGKDTLSWVLIDFVDVVVHVFRDDARGYYALEDIWADAPRIPLPDSESPA